jgi:ribosomal protein S1
LQKDPWTSAAEDFPVGSVIEAAITRLMDFGAFAELAPGVEGLIHISELSTHRVAHAGQVVKPGDKVQVKILAVDLEKKRISLSAAQVQRDTAPAATEPGATSSANSGTSAATAAAAANTSGKSGTKPVKKMALRGGL